MTRRIALMGVKDRVGTSRTALETARLFSRSGERTLLVDADPDFAGDLQFACGDPERWPGGEESPQPAKPLEPRLYGLRFPFLPSAEDFSAVIFDLGSRWASSTASLLKGVDFLCLILANELSLTEAARKKISALVRSGFPLERAGWGAPDWREDSFLKFRDLEGLLEIPFCGRGKNLAKNLLSPREARAPAAPEETTPSVRAEMEPEQRGLLGPLERLMGDPGVSEILVSGLAPVWVERSGKLEKTAVRFEEEGLLAAVMERILLPLGRRVDESSPMVDARLKDGSRVHMIIPPLALDGPHLSIRRFPEKHFGPDEWLRHGSASGEMMDFLKTGVVERLNILISGGTGSGKTTLLNLLAGFVPEGERIITIEEAAELRLPQPHVVRLEARPPNAEGRGAVSIRELVRNALRMRPDRIVVGECRGAEALDMLQAMNTGHEGSMSTLHANSPRDALRRLETLVLFAEIDLPSRAVREQIASAVDLIVQVARLPGGERKIVAIVRLCGLEGEAFTLQNLFQWEGGEYRRCLYWENSGPGDPKK